MGKGSRGGMRSWGGGGWREEEMDQQRERKLSAWGYPTSLTVMASSLPPWNCSKNDVVFLRRSVVTDSSSLVAPSAVTGTAL